MCVRSRGCLTEGLAGRCKTSCWFRSKPCEAHRLKLLVCRHPCAPPRSRDATLYRAATVHGLIDNREPRPLGVPRWANARAESPPRRSASCPTKVHDSRPGLLLPSDHQQSPPTNPKFQGALPSRLGTNGEAWRLYAVSLSPRAAISHQPISLPPIHPHRHPRCRRQLTRTSSSSTFIVHPVSHLRTPLLVSLDPGTTARMCQNVCYST